MSKRCGSSQLLNVFSFLIPNKFIEIQLKSFFNHYLFRFYFFYYQSPHLYFYFILPSIWRISLTPWIEDLFLLINNIKLFYNFYNFCYLYYLLMSVAIFYASVFLINTDLTLRLPIVIIFYYLRLLIKIYTHFSPISV